MAWPKDRPATDRQMLKIFLMLKQLGYEEPRTDPMVRRAYGLTRKQAEGTFTGKEASAFIDRLQEDLDRVGGEIQPEELGAE